MSKLKAYLAGPCFTFDQKQQIDDIEELCVQYGIEVFSPYQASQMIFNGRKPADCSSDERAQVLQGNINGVRDYPLMIAWTGGVEGGGVDTGVVWEMGMAGALSGCPAAFGHEPDPMRGTLAFISDNQERQSMNLMLAGTVDAAALGEAQLQDALECYAKGGVILMSEEFDPDIILAQDKEPLV